MGSNIERAINELIVANKDITLKNVLPAYLQVAGFEIASPDVLLAFEHALDKYPTRRDASQALFAKSVAGLTKEYWSGKPAMVAHMRSTLCDTCASRLFSFRGTAKARACGHDEGEEKDAPKRRVKAKKKGHGRAKQDVATEQLDPYAPSTSAVKL